MNVRTHGPRLVILAAGALLFPPLGVPALLGYLAVLGANHLGRDGGLRTRQRTDAWAHGQPWVTGDEEADQRTLAAMRAEKDLGAR